MLTKNDVILALLSSGRPRLIPIIYPLSMAATIFTTATLAPMDLKKFIPMDLAFRHFGGRLS